jgi:hypothetical protein
MLKKEKKRQKPTSLGSPKPGVELVKKHLKIY